MAIEIVNFPIKKGGSFHSYVKLPEGTRNLVAILMILMVIHRNDILMI